MRSINLWFDAATRLYKQCADCKRPSIIIPPCLSVVSDTAPGITDESLRLGTEMTVFFGSGSFALFVAVTIVGKAKRLWGLVVGIVIPACVTISVWIYFIRKI